MCGRVFSLSRVKGGVERCGVCHEKSVWWCGAAGLVGCLCGRVWLRVFLALWEAIGVVDLSGRVGVVGGGARVGFAVDADSVDGLSDGEAGWLLTRRLRADAVRDRDSGLRVSDGVGLWARGAGGEDDRVALSVVGRDGSRVTLGDGSARRVLAGRPSASEWDVESMLGSFDAAFERGAGTWAADAGDVVLPPSGWDDDMVPAVDDDDE